MILAQSVPCTQKISAGSLWTIRRGTWLVVSLLLFLVASSAACWAEDSSHPWTPWAYGILFLPDEGGPTIDEVLPVVQSASQSVFTFWEFEVPEPGVDPYKMPISALAETYLLAQPKQPELIDMQGYTAYPVQVDPVLDCVPCSLISLGFYHDDPSEMVGSLGEATVVPSGTWLGESLSPLQVVIYKDIESLCLATNKYIWRGKYSHSLVLPSANLYWFPYWPPGITVSWNSGAELSVLIHEFTHWMQLATDEWLWPGTAEGEYPPDWYYMLLEGLAEYTGNILSHNTKTWRIVAPQWSTEGGLSDVPVWAMYSVGASIVDALVEELGKALAYETLVRLTKTWDAEVAEIEEIWRASLPASEPTEAEIAYYNASRQRLGLCAWLVDPVLPDAAVEALVRIESFEGTMADIDLFWVAFAEIPRPSEDAWLLLSRRAGAYTEIALEEMHRGFPASANVLKMVMSYVSRDWETYSSLQLALLRNVIARHGLDESER
jgi:hypothetical protein